MILLGAVTPAVLDSELPDVIRNFHRGGGVVALSMAPPPVVVAGADLVADSSGVAEVDLVPREHLLSTVHTAHTQVTTPPPPRSKFLMTSGSSESSTAVVTAPSRIITHGTLSVILLNAHDISGDSALSISMD